MTLPPETDKEYCHIWHHTMWGKSMQEDYSDRQLDKELVDGCCSTIIKHKKIDWLEGLKERKLPPCLLPWPLVRVDELV